MKRLDSIARSPVYAQFSETLGGLSTIRAFNLTERFMGDHYFSVNVNHSCWFCLRVRPILVASWRWCVADGCTTTGGGPLACHSRRVHVGADLANRVDAYRRRCRRWQLGRLICRLCTVACPGDRGHAEFHGARVGGTGERHERVRADHVRRRLLASPPASCVRLSYTLFRRHYADNTPSEAADVIKDTSSGGVIAPAEWPQRGSITFENVKMRYRPTTPLVLKGISLTINPMEKVGIAGRSGCGKSTLLKCLFRYVACVCGPSECPWAHVVVQARRSGGEDHH